MVLNEPNRRLNFSIRKKIQTYLLDNHKNVADADNETHSTALAPPDIRERN